MARRPDPLERSINFTEARSQFSRLVKRVSQSPSAKIAISVRGKVKAWLVSPQTMAEWKALANRPRRHTLRGDLKLNCSIEEIEEFLRKQGEEMIEMAAAKFDRLMRD